MLDGFSWCSDSVCSRIASLDLVTEDVKVKAVQLNDRLMTQYETQKKKFLLQLDSLLNDVHGDCPDPAPLTLWETGTPVLGSSFHRGVRGWCGVLRAVGRGQGAGCCG